MKKLFAPACLYLVCLVSSPSIAQMSAGGVTIHVQADAPGSKYVPVWNYFGADEPNYSYAPNGEKLLHELAALSPAPVYVRVHNLLTTGNGDSSLKWGSTNAYREDAQGKPVYDWTITDRIFDAMRDAGVRPLVEVGFMPEALSTHPEPYRHSFPKGDVFTGWSYPPKDYDRWSALVTAWSAHLHQRYGASVDGWLWEVWNEPDIAYWHGSPEEYDRLYDVTAVAIRRSLPTAKIGGPESTGPYEDAPKSSAFLRQFLDHCAHGKNAATGGMGAPLDFISFHPKGSPKIVDGHVEMSIAHQLKAVDFGMRVVASFPEWKNTPIIMGENDPEGCAACGTEQNPQNAYRNGPLYGVSIAEATARVYELARSNGVNLQGSVTWAFEFEGQPYFAGLRDLATNGIDKPVLNVFRMWGMLSGDWLPVASTGALPLKGMLDGAASRQSDISAVATRHGKEIDVLVWNYDDRDVDASPAAISMRLAGLHGHSMEVEELLVDREHANAYQAWLKMGSPAQPNDVQRRALMEAGQLTPVLKQALKVNADGNADTSFSLLRQGVALFRFTER